MTEKGVSEPAFPGKYSAANNKRAPDGRSAADEGTESMSEDGARALLPPGFNDILPPDAAFEADIVGRLMARVRASGYEQVKPPVVEYEDTLLAGDGAGVQTALGAAPVEYPGPVLCVRNDRHAFDASHCVNSTQLGSWTSVTAPVGAGTPVSGSTRSVTTVPEP